MNKVQMTIVQIIGVALMFDGSVTAFRTVHMLVLIMNLTAHSLHLLLKKCQKLIDARVNDIGNLSD
jgi:hypothetical protein